MSEPLRPLREDGASTDRATQLVTLVAEIAPRPVDVGKGWDDVIERVARPRSARWLWALAAGAAVLLAWVSLQWPLSTPRPSPAAPAPLAQKAPECAEPMMCFEGSHPLAPIAAPVARPAQSKPAARVALAEAAVEPPRPVTQAPMPPANFVAAETAEWSIPVEGTLDIRRGHVEVKPHAEQYAVTTPEVSMAASTARFAADVTEAGTVVQVFEGEVEVFSYADRHQVTLRAGDERTFAPGGVPSALDVVPPEVSSPSCARRSFEQRIACLGNEAKGDGLRSQAALYEAAYLLSRAGRAATAELTLRESLRRFPHGVLHPEVRLALIKALWAQRRLSEAGEVGRGFLEACPGDPRTADIVSFLRALDWLESR